MLQKTIILVLLFAIIGSLFSGLGFLFRDRQHGSTRTVRALTVRIALSVVLFSLLLIGFHMGWLTPGGR